MKKLTFSFALISTHMNRGIFGKDRCDVEIKLLFMYFGLISLLVTNYYVILFTI